MVMHTYTTMLTRFADGSETDIFHEMNFDVAKTCLTDIKFMINKAVSGTFKKITKYGDLNNIGIMGHSLGGMMATNMCKENSRIKAGINLDGPLYMMPKPFHKPFMFMLAPTYYDMFGDEEGLTMTGLTKEEFKKSLDAFCKKNKNDSYKIILKNAEHCTFDDSAILANFLQIDMTAGSIDGFKAVEIIRAYVYNFFDKYLKGQSSKLLDRKDKRYDADIDFNFFVTL